MTYAEELAYLRTVRVDDGYGRWPSPTPEAINKADAIFTALADAGYHNFAAFSVKDGGVDLQRTDAVGMIAIEISPDGDLRDLSHTTDTVQHVPLVGSDDMALLLRYVGEWSKT